MGLFFHQGILSAIKYIVEANKFIADPSGNIIVGHYKKTKIRNRIGYNRKIKEALKVIRNCIGDMVFINRSANEVVQETTPLIEKLEAVYGTINTLVSESRYFSDFTSLNKECILTINVLKNIEKNVKNIEAITRRLYKAIKIEE